MQPRNSSIFSNIKQSVRQAIGSLLLSVLLWQGISIGSDLAVAANPIADSPAEIVEKVKDRVEGGKAAAIKDGPQLSRTEKPRLPIPRSGRYANERAGQADKTEQYAGDTPDVVQKTADRNVEKAEDFSRKTTSKVKNFFGF